MEANYHFFFDLAARNAARKSRFTLASSFLVGTFFNSCRFSFASMEVSL
jgi:hypothetical protein